MNRQILLILLFFILVCIWSTSVMSAEKDDQWKLASKNMVEGLRNGNDGLKQSIMQNIIRYSDSLAVNEALFDILSIYRDHENEGMRQLALITLYKMKSQWALSFLERAIKFEKSEKIRKSICAILHDCNRPVDFQYFSSTDFAYNEER